MDRLAFCFQFILPNSYNEQLWMIPLRDEILGTCYAMIGMNCENFGILVYSSKFRGGRKDAVFT